jgi:ribosomal protein S27AE
MPRDREKEKARKNMRYATDPVFRERVLASVRERAARRREEGVKRPHKFRGEIDLKRRQCEGCGRLFVSQHERDVYCVKCG